MESEENYFVNLHSVKSYNIDEINPKSIADITKRYFDIKKNQNKDFKIKQYLKEKKDLNKKLESKLGKLEKLLKTNNQESIHNPLSEEFTFNNNQYSIILTKTDFVKEHYNQAVKYFNSNRLLKSMSDYFLPKKINKKDSHMASILQACSTYQHQDELPQSTTNPEKIKPVQLSDWKFGDNRYTIKIAKLEKDFEYAA